MLDLALVVILAVTVSSGFVEFPGVLGDKVVHGRLRELMLTIILIIFTVSTPKLPSLRHPAWQGHAFGVHPWYY